MTFCFQVYRLLDVSMFLLTYLLFLVLSTSLCVDSRISRIVLVLLHMSCIYKSLDFVLNSVFRKIFLIKSYDVASECITFFDCFVSDAIYNRKLKFLTTALRKHYLQTV